MRGFVLFDGIESDSHFEMLISINTVIAGSVKHQIIIHVLLPFHVVLLLDANIGKISKNQRPVDVLELLQCISFFEELQSIA